MRFTEKRMREIRRWIENEQILCTFDSNYFETRYAFICDEQGEVHRFANRRSQEVFDNVIAHFEELQVAIEIFILKSRQVGISTKTALKFLHRLLFLDHVQAVMASVEAEKSELIARIMNICYERCPWWLVPRRTTERVGKMMEWENGSIVSIQSGKQATGIAQGWTPTNVHVSELADIPNPKKVLEEGLLRATHPTRKLFQVWEGTGGGNTGWMADTWRAIKTDFPRGRARMCPVFIPWPLATDLYPEPDWLRKFPIPGDWEPCDETLKHVRRAELYICSTEYLRRICGRDWTMPREQQWFWDFNYLEAVKKRTQRIWFSQMPADDYEALTGKNDLVFTQEVIEVREQERKRDYQAYAIVGNTIDEGFEPDTSIVDYSEPRIEVQWDSHRGQTFDWVLIPLLPFDEDSERNTYDKLLVFEPPIKGKDYSAGIDTADGLGKDDEDRAVCCVTANSRTQPDEQVAEFCSNRINPPQMVGFAACIAAWYGRVARDPRGLKFCIEQRERPGDDCQLQLKLMGFTWHHVMTRYDSKKVKEGEGNKQGWFTNQWSRPFLLNRFVEAINNNWYIPHSKWMITELQDFERKFTVTGKTRLEHQSGKHDDRILAASLSYITRHALEVLAERSTKEYSNKRPTFADVNYNYPAVNQISVGEM
ncbi:MAG: hypothetical protein C5B60_07690 [Chloroflexi bacterium]|nr:MAG: hypothetical protein C5B60_07690 [Chloroflexota bacterium]